MLNNKFPLPSRAKTLNEAKEDYWKIKFHAEDLWDVTQDMDPNDPDEFDNFKLLSMPKLRRFYKKMETFLDDEVEISTLSNIIDDLEEAPDAQDWDFYIEDFYDWADDNRVKVEVEPKEVEDEED